MYILDDGIRLNAILDRPENSPEKQPLLVIIHGFTGHVMERHILAFAKTANDLGIAPLRVDMYGHGSSDGKFEDHTLYKWLSNGLAILNYARSLPFVSKLYVGGHSQGGLTTMLLGAMEQDHLDGILPLSPAWMIPEKAREGELLGQSFDPDHIPDILGAWHDKPLKGDYARVAQMIHVEESIERFHKPVLLVHGDADEAVPYEYGVKAAKMYTDCEFVTIPGDNHCYDYHLEQMTEAVRDWFLRHI